MRIGLSCGHGARWADGHIVNDPGAKHPEIGVTEYETCMRIFKVLYALLSEYKPVELVTAPTGVPLRERVEHLNLDHKHRKKMDLAIELHLNAFKRRDVDGSEVWVHPNNDRALEAASGLLAAISPGVRRPDRGVKVSDEFYFLRCTAMTALLVEPFFITSDNSANDVLTGDLVQRTAYGIFQGIVGLVEGD